MNVLRSALDALTAIPAWVDDAICAQTDPELWFPSPGESNTEAKAICADCPVRDACLADALATRPQEDWGIRGGTSEKERSAMRRKATQPDADVLADMLGLTDPAPDPEPRRRALPRHGGGRKAVTL